ncbi:MAG TPA: hypothetical protein VJ617_20470 [Arthrobacter sp.]|nr:hypothetical protein [Arthrobacter sp.]
MWLRDMIRSLMRRWYVLLFCLAAAAAGTYLVYQTVPLSYSAKGSLVLMPPKTSVGPDGNPYLFLGGMGQALDILSSKLSAEDAQAPILKAHPNVSYSAEPDRSSSGSVVLVTVRGSDRSEVMGALDAVVAAVPTTLAAMQDAQAVPPDSRISMMTLVVDRQPATDTKTRTVYVLATAGGGAALGILLTGFIDGRLLARRGRLEAEAKAEAVPPADDGPSARLRRVRESQPKVDATGAVEESSEAASGRRERSTVRSKG